MSRLASEAFLALETLFSCMTALRAMHEGRSVTEFLEAHGIETLPWPGNSPDMNPIENLWSILKSKMHKKTITNKRQLIEELISAWTREDRIYAMLAKNWSIQCQLVLQH